MTISISELSDSELHLYNKAGYQQQNIELRFIDTSNSWLFKDYKSIHNEYLKICEFSDDGSVKLEALKRLIFLNWEYALEPAYLTGIDELDQATIFNSYKILNNYIKNGLLDTELKWMLSFYSSWEYLIFEYSKDNLNDLNSFVENVDTSILKLPQKLLPKGTMDNRGQMGIYWKEFVEID